MEVSLRPVHDSDLPVFFRVDQRPSPCGWPPSPPRTRPTGTPRRPLEARPRLVRRGAAHDPRGRRCGDDAVYGEPGEREVTYWIEPGVLGPGIATAALRDLLAEVPERPLHARAAADNAGSRRVLEKCGFRVTANARGYAHARGEDTDEVVLTLGR